MAANEAVSCVIEKRKRLFLPASTGSSAHSLRLRRSAS